MKNYLNKIVLIAASGIVACTTSCDNKSKSIDTKFGTVIILNGPSASGKSSIIKAFQEKREEPWLCTGLDNFYVGVLAPKFLDDKPEHSNVMTVKKFETKDGKKVVKAIFGSEGQKVIRGMHRAIAAYAQAGNNVVVDYIKYEDAWIPDFQEALKGINVIFVKVNASLESIEKREKARATSPVGHTRSHYSTVHNGIKYDLEINTDDLNPEQGANKIIEYLASKN